MRKPTFDSSVTQFAIADDISAVFCRTQGVGAQVSNNNVSGRQLGGVTLMSKWGVSFDEESDDGNNPVEEDLDQQLSNRPILPLNYNSISSNPSPLSFSTLLNKTNNNGNRCSVTNTSNKITTPNDVNQKCQVVNVINSSQALISKLPSNLVFYTPKHTSTIEVIVNSGS